VTSSVLLKLSIAYMQRTFQCSQLHYQQNINTIYVSAFIFCKLFHLTASTTA